MVLRLSQYKLEIQVIIFFFSEKVFFTVTVVISFVSLWRVEVRFLKSFLGRL